MHRTLVLWLALLAGASSPFLSPSLGAINVVPDETAWTASLADPAAVGFDDFEGPVTNEYPGIAFAPWNGGTPIATAQFPHDGTNSIFTVAPSEGGGGWVAVLDEPASGFALWTGDLEFNGTIISFYDAASNPLGSFDLLDVGAGNGPFVYGFNGFLSDAPNIARVEVTIDPADAVWFDEVRFGHLATASVTSGDVRRITLSWGHCKERFSAE